MGGALTADLIVEIAWGDTWKTAAPTWVDITTYVQSLSCRRGRDQELDRFEAGTMSMTLDNRDRRFEPEFTGGAYSPDVLPGAPVRVQALHSVTTYDIWRGFIESYSLTYPGAATDAVVRVDCVDGFKYLAQSKLEVYRQVVLEDLPLFYWLLDDVDTLRAKDLSIGGAIGTYEGTVATTTGPFGAGDAALFVDADAADYVDFGLGNPGFRLIGDVTVEFWHKPVNNVSGVVVSARESVSGEGPLEVEVENSASDCEFTLRSWNNFAENTTKLLWGADLSGAWHHIVITRTSAANVMVGADLYVDGVLLTPPTQPASFHEFLWDQDQVLWVGNRGSPSDDWLDGGLAHLALYDYKIDEERIVLHANAAFDVWASETADTRIGSVLDDSAWPAGARDIDTGTVTLASTTVEQQSYLATLKEIERSEDGYLYMGANGDVVFKNRHHRTENQSSSNGTFGPGTADLPTFYDALQFDFDDSIIFNDIRVGPRDRSTVRVEDATSQTAYGQRTLTRNQLHISSGQSLTDLANAYLYRYKDPRLRLDALTIKPEKQPATLYPQILARDIGDRITVQLEPPGGGAEIDQDVFIEAIEHELEVDDWTTTWQVTPTAPSEFLILDTGKLDDTAGIDTGRLGY